MSSSTSTIKLPNGMDMPILGLGTASLQNAEEMKIAVNAALDAGYRAFDTALAYTNEGLLGDVLSELFQFGKYERKDIFITSKIPGSFIGSEEHMRRALSKSLTALKLDYVDLYLIHCPVGYALNAKEDAFPFDGDGKIILANHDLVKAWQVMEQVVSEGQVRAIGVSNFNARQITRIQEVAKVPIATNQVECHVYFQQRLLRKFCKEQGIPVTAYAPLGSPAWTGNTGKKLPILLKDPTVHELAKRYKKTAAQIFDLNITPEDREKLDALDQPQRYMDFEIWTGNTFIDLGKEHPEYPFSDPF